MTTLQSRREHPQFLLAGWVPALICWALGVGYFIVVVAVATTFFFPEVKGPPLGLIEVWGVVAIVTIQAIPVVWLTRMPRAMFWIIFALFQLSSVLVLDRTLRVTPALVYAVFILAASLPRRDWMIHIGAAFAIDAGAFATVLALRAGEVGPLVVISVLTLIGPPYALAVLAGLVYAGQRAKAVLEAERAQAIAMANEGSRRSAVSAERNRIAREIHDVLANHLTSVVMQSKAALNRSSDDPDLMREALRTISQEGAQSLKITREVVGLLRAGDDSPSESGLNVPLPEGLHRLVASAEESGQQVRLSIEGDLGDIRRGSVLACFRIVQESLTNARVHAPGSTAIVHAKRTGEEVEVRVTNQPSLLPDPNPAGPTRPGYGLVGMRERAAVAGGSLTSAALPHGGWETRAVLPVDSPFLATESSR